MRAAAPPDSSSDLRPELQEQQEAAEAFDKIREYVASNALLLRVHETTGISELRLVVLLFALAAAVFLTVLGMGSFIFFVGVCYPGYASFKALEAEEETVASVVGTDEVEEEYEYVEKHYHVSPQVVARQTHWLMYWVVFGTIHLVELIASPIFTWGPAYHGVKLLALLWLFLPQTQGATYVYKRWVRPVLKDQELLIDEQLGKLGDISNEIGSISSDVVGQVGTSMVNAAFHQLGRAAADSRRSVSPAIAEEDEDDDDDLDSLR